MRFAPLIVAAIASSASAAPIVYTTNANTNLLTVDAANNSETLYGNTPFVSDSLAIDNAANLYTADSFGNLWNTTTFPIPVGPTGYTQIGDLDYANNGLWGFSNTNQTLFFYDFGLSAVTYAVADPTLSALTITGVAYDFVSNSVYLSGANGLNNDVLLHWQSNAATLVGTMAHTDAFSYISDIDFDAAGTLYAMTWYHREFNTVNLTNGAVTFVSTGPHRDVNGMAIAPVPEPACLLVVGLGAIALRRRNKA